MIFLKITSLLLSVVSVCHGATWDDLIMPPIDGKSGQTVVVLFGQGADIPTELYEPLGAAIQAASSYPLWFASPQCPYNACAVGLDSAMARIKASMEDQGLDFASSSVFYGGHSLGGAMMPTYVLTQQDEAQGMILMGSFLTREFRSAVTAEGRPQYSYPVPTLTIGAELDGLCRITRIAESLYNQVTFAEDPTAAVRQMPVTVIEGMNHYEFASGDEPPNLVEKKDLKPEISEDDAHTAVAADTVAFISAILQDTDEAWSVIESRASDSADFVQPIIDALQMEAYAQFLPPCYCETQDEYADENPPSNNSRSNKIPYAVYGTCESMPNCTGGTPWTNQVASPMMSNAGGEGFEGLVISSVDSMHDVTETTPSCHHPHIHGASPDYANAGNTGHENKFNPATPPICNDPNNCTLDITTVTQHIYKNSGELDVWRETWDIPSLDTGYLPIAATELKTKLKSREAVYAASGYGLTHEINNTLTDMPMSEGGTGDRCAEINQAAIDWALQTVAPATKERFENFGQTLLVGDDLKTCVPGPCWIWDPLHWKEDDDAGTVTISSVYMFSENYNIYPCGEAQTKQEPIPCATGFHYCKLLSPARAVEWMYVDGLRLKYSGYH